MYGLQAACAQPMETLTFSDAVDQSVSLVDTHKALLEARNVFGDRVLHLLLAAVVHSAPTLLERVGTLV